MTTAGMLRAEGFAEGHRNVVEYVHMTVRQAVWQLSIDGFKDWMARTSTPGAAEEILKSLLSVSPESAPGEPESPGADGGEGSREG